MNWLAMGTFQPMVHNVRGAEGAPPAMVYEGCEMWWSTCDKVCRTLPAHAACADLCPDCFPDGVLPEQRSA